MNPHYDAAVVLRDGSRGFAVRGSSQAVARGPISVSMERGGGLALRNLEG